MKEINRYDLVVNRITGSPGTSHNDNGKVCFYDDHAEIVAALNEQLSRYTMSAGQCDQRRSESDAVRVALGFAADANDVSPSDLLEKIAALNEKVQALAAERDDMNRDAEIAMQLIERMKKQVNGYQAELSRRDSSVKGEIEPMNTGQLKFSLMCWQSDYDSVHDREQYDMFGSAVNAINLLESAQKRIAELEAYARLSQQARDGLLERAIKAEKELAPLYEATPTAITDDMAYAFHCALSDSPLGFDDAEEIKLGLTAAFASAGAAPQPATLPNELDNDSEFIAPYRAGYNKAIADARELGCKSAPVVEIPKSRVLLYEDGSPSVIDFNDIKSALEASGIKWRAAD